MIHTVTTTPITCHCPRAHVRRAVFPLTGELAWRAAVPGGVYPMGHGWHFPTWAEAMAYVTRTLTDRRDEDR